MGIKERRQREKEEVRSTILAAAWKMVRAEGWQALSIRKIADAIEYSIPVIYDHFENKEAILHEFGEEGFNLLTQKIQNARDQHDDAAAQLRAISEAYWNFALSNPEHYQLMYGVGMANCGECVHQKVRFRHLVTEPITRLISEGKQPDSNVCLKYHTFWSILHGLISIRMTRISDTSDQLNSIVVQDAVEGFIKNLS
jgi:AcrR family transcriptional regulator